jgi:flavin-dependent dehydrogenase
MQVSVPDCGPPPDHYDYDVVIFGGGPAGSAAALALARKGFKTALVAKILGASPLVGEAVSPAILRPLSRLGLWEHFLADGHIAIPGRVVIWGSEQSYEHDFIFSPYGWGWHLNRERFDGMLAEAAKSSGVYVYNLRALNCIFSDDRNWDVHLAKPVVCSLRTRWVIDASGRAAWFSRRQAVHRWRMDRLVALIQFAKVTSARENRTLIESCAEGWWYAAVLPEQRAIAAFFTDSDLLPRGVERRKQLWNELLTRTKLISMLMHRAAGSPLHTMAASSGRLDRTAGKNWLAIGDAAQTYDPLSGQGLANALTSGIAAAEAICASAAGDDSAFSRFDQAFENQFEAYRRNHTKYYTLENRWPTRAFWKRRHAYHNVIGGFSASLSVGS